MTVPPEIDLGLAQGQVGTGKAYGGGTQQDQPCNQFNWASPNRSGACFGRAQILPTTFATLSPGHQFVVAIDRDGSVWAWGDEADGELGVAPDNYFTNNCDQNAFPPIACELKPQLVF